MDRQTKIPRALLVLMGRLENDDKEAWNAVDQLRAVFAGARQVFRCPRCGGGTFGSSECHSAVMTRHCHSCQRFTWSSEDDEKYFAWEIRLPLDAMKGPEVVFGQPDGTELKAFADRILRAGPDRVVIDGSGEAVPSRQARERYGIAPDVIFIRRDGWSLGAPLNLSNMAERMWSDDWIGVLCRPDTRAMTYEAYKKEIPDPS